MTEDEARQVAGIALRADNWCNECAWTQIEMLQQTFPEYGLLFQEIYDSEYA